MRPATHPTIPRRFLDASGTAYACTTGAAMAKFTMTHDLDCSVDDFWKTFFDATYNERLYRGALGFPAFEILEQKETDKEITRRCAGQPKMNMPAPVTKLLGSGFKYVEEGSFDKTTKTWRWKLTTSTLADKLRQEGTLRVEPLGDERCRRQVEIVMEAKVFGLGGLIESSAEKSLREGWDNSAKFMNDVWFKQAKS